MIKYFFLILITITFLGNPSFIEASYTSVNRLNINAGSGISFSAHTSAFFDLGYQYKTVIMYVGGKYYLPVSKRNLEPYAEKIIGVRIEHNTSRFTSVFYGIKLGAKEALLERVYLEWGVQFHDTLKILFEQTLNGHFMFGTGYLIKI